MILLLSFFVFINSNVAQENNDTSGFPTIENNPNIELQNDVSELDPDNMKPKIKSTEERKQIAIGESASFFTDIIYGTLFVVLIIVGWNIYKRYFTKSIEEIEN